MNSFLRFRSSLLMLGLALLASRAFAAAAAPPTDWIDPDTGHRIVRLSKEPDTASLYFHHAWAGGVTDPQRFADQKWSSDDHIFGSYTERLPEVDDAVTPLLDEESLTAIVAAVPDAWLEPVPGAETPAQLRAAYVRFLLARLGTRQWLPVVAA